MPTPPVQSRTRPTDRDGSDPKIFADRLGELSPHIEAALKRYAWPDCGAPKRLRESMDYSLFAGGKRLRPALVVLGFEACGGSELSEAVWAASCAYEMVHTYSLIHDDLPAMDDDDLRRGMPSNHKAFDEATAILAGDAMLTYAFHLLAEQIEDAELSRSLIRELARAAGVEGMVAGQQDDLDCEGRDDLGVTELEAIHARKTGALIAAALASGAMVAGADYASIETCRTYGRKLGLAFQVADDILDVTATAEQLGKSPGKDASAGKLTYPGLLGMEAARSEAHRLAAEAAEIATRLPNGKVLASLAHFVVSRGH